jgi:hypothetical protein
MENSYSFVKEGLTFYEGDLIRHSVGESVWFAIVDVIESKLVSKDGNPYDTLSSFAMAHNKSCNYEDGQLSCEIMRNYRQDYRLQHLFTGEWIKIPLMDTQKVSE